ncbi:twin-arginine translocation pathway signal [Plenodomus tracheiphilus IPT5]|uniref:Twin-arginine translocation pathway signal n=1 Tax=Plenodomus tracheiphilus IPT5 TaxID=1408161 RepID=A0A6A7ANZ7_9PLEO|nr:twin-arginine translocation pathway signal [Plenodomus tracheiphilus IPT5]
MDSKWRYSFVVCCLLLQATAGDDGSHTPSLLNPWTRYSDWNFSLPEISSPVLQSSFTTQPDCGEKSYVGRGRLSGRRALVTGGDSGIGRAIVIAYAREGANVAINYLPEEETDAQALSDFLEREGLRITRIPGDITNETFCGSLVHKANRTMGGLDLGVNNAGFAGPSFGQDYQPISSQSTAQLERVFQTNVFANLYITRAAVSLLPPGSSIINTASIVAADPTANSVDYAASKAAVVSITRSLSKQLAPAGIRVNAVAPGVVFTPFLVSAGMNDSILASLLASCPTTRPEMPAELAPVYVDLAASDNGYVSGSIWGATGGLTGF